MKCAKAFEFRYLMGVKTPPRSALTIGSSFHSAVAANLTQKKSDGLGLSLEATLSAYSDSFDTLSQETEWGTDDKGASKDLGAGCVEVHHAKVAPKIKPKAIEERFLIPTDQDYDLGGTMDIVEVDNTIRDSKTSSRAPSDAMVFKSIEAALYDFAFEALNEGKKAKRFVYDVIKKPTKSKPAEATSIAGKVTRNDRQWLFDTINTQNQMLKLGLFPPASDQAYWCSKDWCGYWSMCKGKKR